MIVPVPQHRRPPLSLRAAVSLWLATTPICLALGVLGLTSIASLAAQPLPPALPGAGLARAAIVALGGLTAALEVAFAALPLRHAVTLPRPGTRGRRARRLLTALAAAGTAAVAIGYLAAGTVPFASTHTLHNLAHDTLEVTWLLAALTATALSFSRPARGHLSATS